MHAHTYTHMQAHTPHSLHEDPHCACSPAPAPHSACHESRPEESSPHHSVKGKYVILQATKGVHNSIIIIPHPEDWGRTLPPQWGTSSPWGGPPSLPCGDSFEQGCLGQTCCLQIWAWGTWQLPSGLQQQQGGGHLEGPTHNQSKW